MLGLRQACPLIAQQPGGHGHQGAARVACFVRTADQSHALLGAKGKARHGKGRKIGAVALCCFAEMGFEIHGFCRRCPEPQGVGGFPFIFADEDMG